MNLPGSLFLAYLFSSSFKAILPSEIQPRHFPLYSHSLCCTNFTKPSSIMRFRFLKQKTSFVVPTSHIPSLGQWFQNQTLTWLGKEKGKNTMQSLKLGYYISVLSHSVFPRSFHHLPSLSLFHSHCIPTSYHPFLGPYLTLGLHQYSPWVSNSSQLPPFLSSTKPIIVPLYNAFCDRKHKFSCQLEILAC